MFFQKYKYHILLFLVGLAFLSLWAVWETRKAGEFRVIFFDVGQGDSIFIEDEAGHQILIDGGQGDEVLEKLGEVLPFFDRSLDLVILTHPHEDHLGGLLEVLKRYRVDLVLYSDVDYTNPYFQEFQKILEDKGIAFAFPQANQRINLVRGAYLEILYPFDVIKGQEFADLNNTSLVCRLVRGKTEYLLMGDAEAEVEAELVLKNIYFPSDVLKVGHHGSKTSSGENFLKAVAPEVAVISLGDNRFGHPHQVVLDRFESLGIRVLRTDQEGDIEY